MREFYYNGLVNINVTIIFKTQQPFSVFGKLKSVVVFLKMIFIIFEFLGRAASLQKDGNQPFSSLRVGEYITYLC